MMFQSTPPHGERPRNPLLVIDDVQFQSTPPHGERRMLEWIDKYGVRFQSTPPHGERLLQANTLCGNTKKTG